MSLLTKKQILNKLESHDDNELFEFKEKSKKSIRSYKQVKYYFGVLIKIISDHTGYTPFEVNVINKSLFYRETFTDITTTEFENIMSLIRQYYHYHLNISIPKPNEEYFFYD